MRRAPLNHLAHVLQITPVGTAAASTQSPDPSPPPPPPPSRPPSLDEHVSSLSSTLGLGSDQSLAQLLRSLAACVASISNILRYTNVNRVGSHNRFGDDQLNVDVATHQVHTDSERAAAADWRGALPCTRTLCRAAPGCAHASPLTDCCGLLLCVCVWRPHCQSVLDHLRASGVCATASSEVSE